MALELDQRQRAMLREMGVPVWLPMAAPVAVAPVPAQETAAAAAAAAAAVWPAMAHRKTGAGTPAPDVAVQVAAKPELPVDIAQAGWPALSQAVAACQACSLCAGRKNTVLGSGAVRADWLVVGDPPDEEEEREGLAFAGQSGQLLDNMLKAVGASRGGQGPDGAYLTNIVKCRPVGARNPEAADLASCEAYLRRQVALVQPKVILAMGRFAIQALLQSSMPDLAKQPLGKLRGATYAFEGVPVIVTYHPKSLLRSLPDKAKAWADLCRAMDLLAGAQD
jgi:DNA polymerase